MDTKRIIVSLILVLMCACQTTPPSEKYDVNPLKDIPFNLGGAASTQPATYDLQAIRKNGSIEKSIPYGSLVTSTTLENGNVVLFDKLTADDKAENGKLVFNRTIVFRADDLFVPQRITIDLSVFHPSAVPVSQSMRIFDFENGVAKVVDEDGTKGTEHLDFSTGILTFNALIRLAPLLPRNVGTIYTFLRSDEEFLFPIHTANKIDPIFTLQCESLETIQVGEKRYECVKLVDEQKSIPNKMDLWVDTARNLVVKFTDYLPEGADADRIEATLKE